MNRLKEKYEKVIVSSLREKYNYKSIMEVPKLDKIVVNIGCGDATGNSKLLEAAMNDLEAITGQKPIATKSKKSKPTKSCNIFRKFICYRNNV